jgi:hypothetical protein
VTWEQILRTMQPYLVRQSGCCKWCGTKFDKIVIDST